MKTPRLFGKRSTVKGFLVRAGFLGILSTVTVGGCAHTFAGAQSGPASAEPTKRMAAGADPSFEVATIKPHNPNSNYNDFSFSRDRIALVDQTVLHLIVFAYAINRRQIANAPAWINNVTFDVEGKSDAKSQPNVRQEQEMVKKLLAERFGLQFHREKRELPVYALQIAKGGPRLTPTQHPDAQPTQHNDGHGTQTMRSFTSAAMSDFVQLMEYFVDRPIIDQTGLTGRYDFKLTYTYADATNSDPDSPPPLFTALQEQIGLKFQPMKAVTDVLIVDQVEQPSPN